ncbi:hypothetical protein BX600DRAFT_462044 [Xylariales sp. PMI_506]|nr:hypothetical protein BX600DRAFT_462044 [Xylariales sp. PMI_506]
MIICIFVHLVRTTLSPFLPLGGMFPCCSSLVGIITDVSERVCVRARASGYSIRSPDEEMCVFSNLYTRYNLCMRCLLLVCMYVVSTGKDQALHICRTWGAWSCCSSRSHSAGLPSWRVISIFGAWQRFRGRFAPRALSQFSLSPICRASDLGMLRDGWETGLVSQPTTTTRR